MAPLGQAQDVLRARPIQEPMTPTALAPAAKEIPFDYVARFQLRGQRGNRVQEVINISVEGAFVAMAVGYSFIPARRTGGVTPAPFLNAAQRHAVLAALGTANLANFPAVLANQPLPAVLAQLQFIADPVDLLRCLQQRLCGIDFRYSIVDSATGRELQNQPIHNIAGLGESAGNRPFRPFAKPALFLPRSTIRIEVEEISEGPLYGYDDENDQRVGAELFIVLHGYKILGFGVAPA